MLALFLLLVLFPTALSMPKRSHMPSFCPVPSPKPPLLSAVATEEECELLSESRCKECESLEDMGSMCNECRCLFHHSHCATTQYCSNTLFNLGLNCSSHEGAVRFLLSALEDTSTNLTNANTTLCLSRRICRCLSRGAVHDRLIDTEEQCRQLCMVSEQMEKTFPSKMGALSENKDVCNPVHAQFCRRHKMSGRSVNCARQCKLQGSCRTLIEGILEGEFEGNDVDAAVTVMREFRKNGAHRLPARDFLMAHGSFYRAIENNSSTVISHLNNNNSQDLVSLFDDLLSKERQEEWAEIQQGDKQVVANDNTHTEAPALDLLIMSQENQSPPGQEVLDRIETTIHLLGMSHQLRTLDMQLLNHFHYIGTNIEMNVECQGNRGYQYAFHRGIEEARLSVPGSGYNNNCSRIIAAALSSNLGEFVSNDTDTVVDTDVMTIETVSENTLTNITIFFPSLNNGRNLSNVSAKCVFWNSSESRWSNEGVKLVNLTETHYICHSTHLSSFAVLVSVKSPQRISEAEARALSAVTYVGCCISILCLLFTLLCMVVFRKALNKGVLLYIHFNLFLALLLALILFVAGLETARHIKWLCTTVAALLHYLFLCVFCWMLAEGILLYVLVVKSFTTNFKKWYYFLPLGWGAPLLIVAVSLGVRHEYYGNDKHCWLSHDKGLVWSFIGPMLAIIVVNSVILVLTVVSITHVRRKASNKGSKINTSIIWISVKSAIVLLPLLGVTWIIGLFAVNKNTTVFAWIFTVLNSLQGLMILVFHILRNRKLWSKISRRCGLTTPTEKRNSFSTEYTSTGKRESAPECMPSDHLCNGDISPSWQQSHLGSQNPLKKGSVGFQRSFSDTTTSW